MITTIGTWYIKPGKEAEARKGLKKLAADVKKHETGTMIYIIHVPNMKGFNLPPPSPTTVYFYEVYKDQAALNAHLNGAFKSFVAKHKDLFLTTQVYLPDGSVVDNLFVTGNTVDRLAGFVRPGAG